MKQLLNSMEIDDSLEDEPLAHCNTCGGIGMLQLATGARLTPCPDCEKGQAMAREIMARKTRSTELPTLYRDASLSVWFGVPNDEANPEQKQKAVLLSRKGKILAFLSCFEFVQHPDNVISSHAVASRVKNLMPNSPDWIENILKAPDALRRGFVLQGPVGTGKTWLAAAVMNDLVEQGKVVLYMRAQDIIGSLKETWNNNEMREADVLDRYKTVPFLFIDDMNLELRGKDLLPHQKGYMEAIIRHRSNHQLHSFITCNIDNQQFYEQWGSRIADVITADLQWVKMSGDPFRNTSQEWGDL